MDEPIVQTVLFATIISCHVLNSVGSDLDQIILVTHMQHILVLAWDSESRQVQTRMAGSLRQKYGMVSDATFLATTDCDRKLMLAQTGQGVLRLVSLGGNRAASSTTLHVAELSIVQLQFLHVSGPPVLAVIYQDFDGHHRHVICYRLDLSTLVITSTGDHWKNVGDGSGIIIALRHISGAFIIAGNGPLKLFQLGRKSAAAVIQGSEAPFCSYITVHDNRFVLGDANGYLFLVDINSPSSARVRKISRVNCYPSSLSLLGNRNTAWDIFVASEFGDSVVVSVDPKNLDLFYHQSDVNLGPITDLCVPHENQIVTCSGAFKYCSLRFVKNGFGFSESLLVDMSGLTNVFLLKPYLNRPALIVLAYLESSKLLRLENGELEEHSDEGDFITGQPTLHVCTLPNGNILHITSYSILLYSSDVTSKQEWRSSYAITAVCQHSKWILMSTEDRMLYLFELSQDFSSFILIRNSVTENEIRSLGLERSACVTRYAMCFWGDKLIHFCDIKTSQKINSCNLQVESVVNSMEFFAISHSISMVALGLSDGSMLFYNIDETCNASGRIIRCV
eukprot:Partr_v1_DN28709_c3_g1_i8_m62285 putative DNA binding protein